MGAEDLKDGQGGGILGQFMGSVSRDAATPSARGSKVGGRGQRRKLAGSADDGSDEAEASRKRTRVTLLSRAACGGA